jgi:DNA invertase Pin-like site-specific DNA recombinase
VRLDYARASTADQNPDLQEDALQKAGCEKIFRDVASGAIDSRQGLAEAIEYSREGDTLVVWSWLGPLRTISVHISQISYR